MNTRYTETFLFLSRLSRRSNKGFALGFVLCVGVLMAGTGAVMLLKSSSETEKIVAQEATAKGKTVAEVAISRMQYLLGKYPFLAEMPMDNWQNADVTSEIREQLENSCVEDSEIDAKVTASTNEIGGYIQKSSGEYQWLEMNPSNSNEGKFRFVAFDPAIAGEKMATLTIEAKANVGNDLKEAPSKLTVTIPLNENNAEIDAAASPGLWVKNGSGLDDIVAANVWIGSGGDDCSVTDDADQVAAINTKVFGNIADYPVTDHRNGGGISEAIRDGELLADPNFKPTQVAEHKFPDETVLSETYAQQITDAGVTPIDISSDLLSNSDALGGYPEKKSHNPLSTFARFMNGFGQNALNNIFGRAAVASTSGCGTQVLANKNGSGFYVFPRPGDTATRTQIMDDGRTLCIYDYKITKDLGGMGIVVRTVNAEGNRQRVIFHLEGNIGNNTEIAHIGNNDLGNPTVTTGPNKPTSKIKDVPDCTSSCKPVDFQVWGHTTTSVCLNGNKKLHAFLWAPQADMGVKGSGNGKGGLNGTAFVNTWNESCSSDAKSGAHVVQTGEWLDLGLETPDATPPLTVGQPASVKTEQYQ